MDLEGFVRRRLASTPRPALVELVRDRILEHKETDARAALELARAVIEEVEVSLRATSPVCTMRPSGVSMGRFGVGSRGTGDMHVHRSLAGIIGSTGAEVDALDLDDAGVVACTGGHLVVTVDGMHSRLSEFPLLAGFHVARAALRDVWVMGARPLAMLADVHVADDGDVARVFEFVAGVAAVGELTGVPLVTGSTLRIGGDLVLGERLTGCVGAVGETARLTPRRALEAGDLLLMTEGGGGGTITAAAIYGGFPEVVEETLNVQLLDACADLAARPEWGSVHAMTDVTNGGLRGDAHEMAATTGLGIVVDRGLAAGLVRPAVARMLDSLRIDPLGVSLDALLVAAPPRVIDALGRALTEIGVRSEVIGEVRAEPGVRQRIDGEEREFAPRFRESAYTPVKKVVGEAAPEDLDELARRVTEAAEHAKQRKAEVVRTVAARRTRATQ